MKVFGTKAEAIFQAKLHFEEDSNDQPWEPVSLSVAASRDFEIYAKATDAGGPGGLVIVIEHGGEDEGIVLAVADYTASVAEFGWTEDPAFHRVKPKRTRKERTAAGPKRGKHFSE